MAGISSLDAALPSFLAIALFSNACAPRASAPGACDGISEKTFGITTIRRKGT